MIQIKIAIIGWGSLIWDSGELKIIKPWQPNGPKLPVEFARISNNGRVTLVIYLGRNDNPSPTSWALSTYDDLGDAREDLRKREVMPDFLNVHGVTKEGAPIGPPRGLTTVFSTVRDWLKKRDQLDAAIWTGLESNWEGTPEIEQPFSPIAVVAYLKGLRDEKLKLAQEYFVKAPRGIDTPVRREVIKKLGWTPAEEQGKPLAP